MIISNMKTHDATGSTAGVSERREHYAFVWHWFAVSADLSAIQVFVSMDHGESQHLDAWDPMARTCWGCLVSMSAFQPLIRGSLLLQGAGIMWPTGFGNLEANWCRILSSQPTDRLKTGFQLGFSGKW